jgi:hypothetical protein
VFVCCAKREDAKSKIKISVKRFIIPPVNSEKTITF